ncbi:DUF6415 family natural product biosynthesis protein [Streptomyces europaeiscabiei]|uniref:DUF6415 family natural product biosynthesis protein n=1 Tax=Streptomyces europaeiscabiei TaxID=146819 RepID=UPI002E193880
MTATRPGVDAMEVHALITEALGATGVLPPHARLAELDEQLREEINRLIPIVRDKSDHTELRSRDWYALQQAADHAEDSLTYKLDEQPLAGALHVAELARRLCALQQAEGAKA